MDWRHFFFGYSDGMEFKGYKDQVHDLADSLELREKELRGLPTVAEVLKNARLEIVHKLHRNTIQLNQSCFITPFLNASYGEFAVDPKHPDYITGRTIAEFQSWDDRCVHCGYGGFTILANGKKLCGNCDRPQPDEPKSETYDELPVKKSGLAEDGLPEDTAARYEYLAQLEDGANDDPPPENRRYMGMVNSWGRQSGAHGWQSASAFTGMYTKEEADKMIEENEKSQFRVELTFLDTQTNEPYPKLERALIHRYPHPDDPEQEQKVSGVAEAMANCYAVQSRYPDVAAMACEPIYAGRTPHCVEGVSSGAETAIRAAAVKPGGVRLVLGIEDETRRRVCNASYPNRPTVYDRKERGEDIQIGDLIHTEEGVGEVIKEPGNDQVARVEVPVRDAQRIVIEKNPRTFQFLKPVFEKHAAKLREHTERILKDAFTLVQSTHKINDDLRVVVFATDKQTHDDFLTLSRLMKTLCRELLEYNIDDPEQIDNPIRSILCSIKPLYDRFYNVAPSSSDQKEEGSADQGKQ